MPFTWRNTTSGHSQIGIPMYHVSWRKIGPLRKKSYALCNVIEKKRILQWAYLNVECCIGPVSKRNTAPGLSRSFSWIRVLCPPWWEWCVSHDLRGALYCGSTERRRPNEDSWFLRHLPVLPPAHPCTSSHVPFFNVIHSRTGAHSTQASNNILCMAKAFSQIYLEFPLIHIMSVTLYTFSTNTHSPFFPRPHALNFLFGELQ